MNVKCTENKNMKLKRKYNEILDNKQPFFTLFKGSINTQDSLF